MKSAARKTGTSKRKNRKDATKTKTASTVVTVSAQKKRLKTSSALEQEIQLLEKQIFEPQTDEIPVVPFPQFLGCMPVPYIPYVLVPPQTKTVVESIDE